MRHTKSKEAHCMKRVLILLATMALIVWLSASVALAQQGDEMGQENEMKPEDHMMRQDAMTATATAMSSSSATATAGPTATSVLPDTGGSSLATPIALAAALALVGSGIGALAFGRRRAP